MAKLTSFILLAAAALKAVTAAYIPRDDQECASFENLLSSSNPQFSCLAPFGKLGDLGSTNASAATASGILDTWLTEFCAVPACSTDTLNQVANITSGCGSGSNGTQFAQQYLELRELFCLRDTTNNTFCTTEALTSGNTTDTTDDTSSTSDTNIEEALFVLALGSSGLGTCNECTKAQYQVAVKFGQTDTSEFLGQCSADFIGTSFRWPRPL
ncbi:hypothetical protein C8R45DRAFT_1215959 [Mycena sanguinolenta]|nr:hypothetical protein C8R45DRAFT_1215959 [Mycena sanguinolenta]